jgi:uncharacterized protein
MKRFVFAVVLGAGLGFWALSGPAWSQAFNCNFAKAADELTICRDDSLKALDEQMSDRFFKIRQQLPTEGQAQLKAGQKDFLSRRKFCGTDGDCIEGMYKERMETLCTLATDFGVACDSTAE